MRFFQLRLKVAGDPPGEDGQEDGGEDGRPGDGGVQAGPTVTTVFYHYPEYGGGDGEEEEGIVVPCIGPMAVQSGVQSALTAAAGTIVACEHAQRAAGRKMRRRGIVEVVHYAYSNGNDSHKGHRCR